MIVILSIQTNLKSQSIDYFTETKLPDTLVIQYLSKADGQPTDFHAKSFADEISKDSLVNFQLIYSQSNGKTRFLVKAYGKNRFNALDIIRKYFNDAYYVDDRGWKINY